MLNVPEGRPPSESRWSRISIARIENLSDAVYGAGLEAMQLSRAPVRGSLAFAEHDGVLHSTGYIDGRVALTGPLSQSLITFGIGLYLPPGTRHWLNEVTTGDFGIFMPGDNHDSIYPPGSLYATVSLSAESLDAIGENCGFVLPGSLGGTGVHPRRFSEAALAKFRSQYEHVHAGRSAQSSSVAVLGNSLLDAVVEHLGRRPHATSGRADPRGYARIVARARAYILASLDQPLLIDQIARASSVSRRTMYRAFIEVLDETPHTYVRKLRLHRIRYELASDAERACTITLVANRWGIAQLGRLSGWYRELFGEYPSETLARSKAQ